MRRSDPDAVGDHPRARQQPLEIRAPLSLVEPLNELRTC
jgi:hypothetical protein